MSDCLFCKIINREVPAIVEFEDEHVVAFRDINPKAAVHLLIIPKKHIARVSDMSEEDIGLMGRLIFTARQLAEKLGISERGFKLVFNNGHDGGQIIDHVHLHLLGGEKLTGLV